MLAIIPSIGRSPLLTDLVKTLLSSGASVVIVDNDPTASGKSASFDLIDEADKANPRLELLPRQGWGIYRTWNFGLDLAVERGHECALILNDDIVLSEESIRVAEKLLGESGFAIVSFFDPVSEMQSSIEPKDPSVLLADTTESARGGWEHALAGYAFAANPELCARCDERFHWYYGDDDLFRTTASTQRIGVAHSAKVEHPKPRLSSTDIDVIMPNEWHRSDLALSEQKVGSRTPSDDGRPHLFVGIPSRDGKISAAIYRWLSSLQVLTSTGRAQFTMTVMIAEGYSPVHYARNIICREARKTNAAKVVMIDDDMLPDETTVRILSSSADIVVPRMFRFRHNGPIAETAEDDRPPEIATCATYVKGEGEAERRFDVIPALGADEEIEVQAAGTGFIVIRREVLDDERMRCGPDDSDGTPALFRMIQTSSGRITEWEDVDFTLRAHRLGYRVAADLGAHCGHRKAINLDAVYEMVYRGNQSEVLVAK